MPERMNVKRIAMGALLCLALGLTVFAAIQVAQGVARFRQDRALALSGDVRAIRPWMTIPYVARLYHVPERYLLQSLRISDPTSVRHVTLSTLAARLHVSSSALIHELQVAILTYRKQQQQQPTPTRSPTRSPRLHSAIPPPPADARSMA